CFHPLISLIFLMRLAIVMVEFFLVKQKAQVVYHCVGIVYDQFQNKFHKITQKWYNKARRLVSGAIPTAF
ncbi:MAG: hypothetical protein RLZZ367_73, partial [Bacteroidota bacterium]